MLLRCGVLLVGLSAAAMVLGCSGNSGGPQAASQPTNAGNPAGNSPQPQANASGTSEDPTTTEREDGLVRTDAAGRKWLNGVPYDVWFNDPLSVAADTQAVPVASNAANTAESPNGGAATVGETGGTRPAAVTNAGAPPATDWKAVIPGEMVDAEVTSIRNRFTERLRSVGSYNSSYLELPPYVATLAVLAGIAGEHPDDIRWKENGKYIRDLAAQMASEQLQPGPKAYKQVQLPFEQVVEILNGSRPAGLPESADETDFSAVADFGYLMKRLDVASKWLKVNVSSADALKENQEDVLREASVLAALGQVITTQGYGYSDDEQFLEYARPFVAAGVKMAQAARNADFPAFDEALNRAYRSCSDCHTTFRD